MRCCCVVRRNLLCYQQTNSGPPLAPRACTPCLLEACIALSIVTSPNQGSVRRREMIKEMIKI